MEGVETGGDSLEGTTALFTPAASLASQVQSPTNTLCHAAVNVWCSHSLSSLKGKDGKE